MKEIKCWLSEDGKLFTNKEECQKYEYHNILSGVVFFDSNMKPTKYDPFEEGRGWFADECYGIYINTDEAASALYNFFESWSKDSFLEHPFLYGDVAKGRYMWIDDGWEKIEELKKKAETAERKFSEAMAKV